MSEDRYRILALNGGRVTGNGGWRFDLPVVAEGYADAQIDDYGRSATRRAYPWGPGTRLRLRARFSHAAGELVGTAGFGFWNAPFGDPTVRWPALPQAAWFFYASAPTDLPLPAAGPGRGWFAATLDATTPAALSLAPLAPLALLLHQVPAVRRRLWPWIRRRLGISFAPLPGVMTAWQAYELAWTGRGVVFWVNGRVVLQTPHAPRGPLGFVCWLDNQYLVATPTGRLGWGTLPVPAPQWMEVADLRLGADGQ
ncbi:MAG: hypothetical protein KC425_09315 [Anaerolineales bacterium]|nr:hypothetical protein [Anaerolineales bacterium]